MVQFIELTETSFLENLPFQIIASDLFPLAIQHSLVFRGKKAWKGRADPKKVPSRQSSESPFRSTEKFGHAPARQSCDEQSCKQAFRARKPADGISI